LGVPRPRKTFIRLTQPWDGFYSVSRRLVEELGNVLVTPSASYLSIATRWTRALLEAYAGNETVKHALAKAARDVDAVAAPSGGTRQS